MRYKTKNLLKLLVVETKTHKINNNLYSNPFYIIK